MNTGTAALDAGAGQWPLLSARRADVYAWFSGLFALEMPQQTIDAYQAGDAAPLLAALAEAGLADEAARVERAVQAWAALPLARVELAADFARLFLLDARDAAVPYASAYLDPQGQFFGKPHQQMHDFLQRQGLRVRTDFREPSDHLAVILAYAEHAIREQAGATAAGAAAGQLEFLQDALLTWLPAFAQRCAQLGKDAASDFYPALADLLLAFVREDVACLESEAGVP